MGSRCRNVVAVVILQCLYPERICTYVNKCEYQSIARLELARLLFRNEQELQIYPGFKQTSARIPFSSGAEYRTALAADSSDTADSKSTESRTQREADSVLSAAQYSAEEHQASGYSKMPPIIVRPILNSHRDVFASSLIVIPAVKLL